MRTFSLYFAAALFLMNLAGAYLLDALGLIQGLLSPHGASIVFLVPLATVFYAARLSLYFVAPGLLLGALLTGGSPVKARKNPASQ